MKKYNLWIFNHYAMPPELDNGYRHYKFAEKLIEKGYNVKIFTASTLHFKKSNLITDSTPFIEKTFGLVDFIFIKARSYTGNGKQRICNWLDYIIGLFKIHSKVQKPDIIIASSVHPLTCVAGLLIAKKYKIKCIIEIRDLWPETLVAFNTLKKYSLLARGLYRLEKWIYKKADAVIFTMQGGEDYIIDKGWDKSINLDKVYHLNNGVDLQMFNHHKESYKLEDDDLKDTNIFKIIYTGSIGEANQVEVIIDAAKRVQEKQCKNIKFILFGDGERRKALEQRIKDEHIDNVVFKGNVDKKYVPYILSQGDLNIFTGKAISLYQYGISLNKMFEYFASGKPTLSNVECGYNIIDTYECGITVTEKSIESLAEVILKFYDMPPHEYQAYCIKALSAARAYDFNNLTDQLQIIIKNTMEDNHRKGSH